MKIEYTNGLLYAELTLSYQGKTKAIDRLIIDTGAAQTLLSADAVFDLGVFAVAEDELTVMSGIGGEELAFRKLIDHVIFDTMELDQFPLDFGDLDEGFGINGIFLKRGSYIRESMKRRQKAFHRAE
jgi:hypothetical protein